MCFDTYVQGYQHILLYKGKERSVDDDSLEEPKPVDIDDHLNALAYSNILLCCEELPFSIVEMSNTEKFPQGDVREARSQLKRRFEAENYTTKVQLKREYASCKLGKGQDPDMWLIELEYIKRRLLKMGSKIEEEDFIAHIVSNLGKEYDQLVNVLEGEMEGLTSNKLKERIRSYYDRVVKVKEQGVTTEDQALWHEVKTGRKGGHLHKFKGRCNKCGKYGHKGVHCRPEGNKREQETSQVCHYCKKPGHIKKYCYELRGAKKNDGHESTEECALIAKTVQHCTGDDVWYADSGASKHMTNNPRDFFDVVALNGEIVVGNNESLTCKAKGKLKVKFQIRKGESIQILLNEVLYVPEI